MRSLPTENVIADKIKFLVIPYLPMFPLFLIATPLLTYLCSWDTFIPSAFIRNNFSVLPSSQRNCHLYYNCLIPERFPQTSLTNRAWYIQRIKLSYAAGCLMLPGQTIPTSYTPSLPHLQNRVKTNKYKVLT